MSSSKPLHPKFLKAVQSKETQWIVLLVLNPDLDWCAALAGAKLKLAPAGNIAQAALTAPGKTSLGLLQDSSNWPPHLLVLRPGGLPHELVSAGNVNALVKIGSRLPRCEVEGNEDDDSVLELRPLASGDSYASAPLMFWKLGPVAHDQDVTSSFVFSKISEGRKNKEYIEGRSPLAPKLQLTGKTEKISLVRYLLGAIVPGTRKAMVFEADVYWVQRDFEYLRDREAEMQAELEERKNMNFKEMRSGVINAAGAATKVRQMKSKEQRQVDDTKVVELSESVGQLRKRAASSKSLDAIREEDMMKDHRDNLPQFNAKATQVDEIYNLDKIAPPKLVDATDALAKDLVELVQDPAQILRKPNDLREAVGSGAAASVAHQWAESSPSVMSRKEAKSFARRLGVLRCLVSLYKLKFQIHKLPSLCKELSLPNDSQIGDHWFRTLLDEMPGDKWRRRRNQRRIMYYMIVWVLYLMPKFSLDFAEFAADLGVNPDEMRRYLMYAGCITKAPRVARDGNVDTEQQLMAELKAPLTTNRFARGGGFGKRRKKS